MFESRNGALVPFKSQKLTAAKRNEIARYGGDMLKAVHHQIHDLAQVMIESYDDFELRMLGLQIDAWSDRRQIVEEWIAERQEAEERLFESYLRYRKQLLPEGEALDLLAEAERTNPASLQDDYATFRSFVRDHGHRLPAAKRVLAEDSRRSVGTRRADLKRRLAEAERRFAKKRLR